jgi:peptidyl-prolyl cis-trans isomerase B (cyclophilin B)
MARSQSFNSASSQFFIMHADGKFLDGQYAAFGKVIAGMEFVDEIASVKTDYSDRPVIDMRMKTVTLVEE